MKTIFELGPDYKGRTYGPPFYVAQWHGIAPGWFVFGRNEEYEGRCIKIVALCRLGDEVEIPEELCK